MHKAWCCLGEVPYCFSRSSIKFQGHTAQKIVIWPRLGVSGLLLQFEFTNGYEMMHKAWSSIEEVPYSFSRSSIKFQGHTALKIVEFDPHWAFPDCNSSLNSPVATKCCSKLEVAWKRCPFVFQGHMSNCKVTRLKNRRFWPKLGVSGLSLQFEFTNGYEMMPKARSSIEEVPYCFSRSSVKLQGHTAKKIVDFDPN